MPSGPFAIGRESWMFSTSVDGVKASANLYSLIETGKANGLELYAYLKCVHAELPNVVGYDDLGLLLPENIKGMFVRCLSSNANKEEKMGFIQLKDLPELEITKGIKAHAITTDTISVLHVTLDNGAILPEHSHYNEQVVNVIEGELELVV